MRLLGPVFEDKLLRTSLWVQAFEDRPFKAGFYKPANFLIFKPSLNDLKFLMTLETHYHSSGESFYSMYKKSWTYNFMFYGIKKINHLSKFIPSIILLYTNLLSYFVDIGCDSNQGEVERDLPQMICFWISSKGFGMVPARYIELR